MHHDSEPSRSLSASPAGEFLRNFWRLDHALERVSRDMEARLGVTAPQRAMIRCIGRFPGVTATQLAAHFHLDAGTISAALARLEKKGLVRRRRDPRDGRRVTLALTAAGRAVDGATHGTVEHVVERFLDVSSPEEIRGAVAVLERLTALLEAEVPPSPRASKRARGASRPSGARER